MKTDRCIFSFTLIFILMLTGGCSKETISETSPVKEKLVKVQETKEEALPVLLRYTGMTSAGELKKYSFKVPGKLSEFYVEKGSHVRTGERLASVATTELELAVQASRLTVQKAENAYTEALDSYTKLEKLFQAGALAETDLKKAKLDLDIKEASYDQANVELQSKEIQFNDASIYSDMDGYVVDILFKKSEVIAAGYPVVVLRNDEQKVTVGLSQNDVRNINTGTIAKVNIAGIEAKGVVTRIDSVPDSQSRTYNTEILLSEPYPSERFFLGATAQVEFELGMAKGIWVPLASVLNDGEDYIFEVKDNRAVKKNIKLLDIQGFNVRVDGLAPGEEIVTMGMKALKEGTKVQLQSEGESK